MPGKKVKVVKKRPALKAGGKGKSQVLPTIHTLCTILTKLGVQTDKKTPEFFRLAKFDEDEAQVNMFFWRLLHHLCLVRVMVTLNASIPMSDGLINALSSVETKEQLKKSWKSTSKIGEMHEQFVTTCLLVWTCPTALLSCIHSCHTTSEIKKTRGLLLLFSWLVSELDLFQTYFDYIILDMQFNAHLPPYHRNYQCSCMNNAATLTTTHTIQENLENKLHTLDEHSHQLLLYHGKTTASLRQLTMAQTDHARLALDLYERLNELRERRIIKRCYSPFEMQMLSDPALAQEYEESLAAYMDHHKANECLFEYQSVWFQWIASVQVLHDAEDDSMVDKKQNETIARKIQRAFAAHYDKSCPSPEQPPEADVKTTALDLTSLFHAPVGMLPQSRHCTVDNDVYMLEKLQQSTRQLEKLRHDAQVFAQEYRQSLRAFVVSQAQNTTP